MSQAHTESGAVGVTHQQQVTPQQAMPDPQHMQQPAANPAATVPPTEQHQQLNEDLAAAEGQQHQQHLPGITCGFVAPIYGVKLGGGDDSHASVCYR